jgi:hypothetical protein
MNLTILPRLRDVLPRLSDERFAALEAAIVTAGRAERPIRVAEIDGQTVIVDGHNRYAICLKHGVPYTVENLGRKSLAEAIDVAIGADGGSGRHMTDEQMLVVLLREGKPIPVRNGYTARRVQRVRDLLGSGPDEIARILDPNKPYISIDTAWGKWNRRTNPAAAKPRAAKPAPATPAPERTVETITAETRARAAASAAQSDAKKLAARITELEDQLNFRREAEAVPMRIHTPSARPKSGLRIATPLFLLSDLHFGETVTAVESLGLNTYDLEIAAARMAKCWDNMLWLRADMARTQSCDDTVISLNGDIVSGDIHAELSETNDGGLRAQCRAARVALAPGILAMAEATPGTCHVVCIGGNHGRLTHKQQIKNGHDHSAEHLGVYDPLREQIGVGPRGNIAWHIPEAERYIFDVHGRRVSQQHGTMIRSQGGIGGTLVPMTRWVTRAADADLYLFGHFHEADAYGRIVKNGALIGDSAYTRWLGVESRPPEQVAFVIDADRGVRRFERVSVT